MPDLHYHGNSSLYALPNKSKNCCSNVPLWQFMKRALRAIQTWCELCRNSRSVILQPTAVKACCSDHNGNAHIDSNSDTPCKKSLWHQTRVQDCKICKEMNAFQKHTKASFKRVLVALLSVHKQKKH